MSTPASNPVNASAEVAVVHHRAREASIRCHSIRRKRLTLQRRMNNLIFFASQVRQEIANTNATSAQAHQDFRAAIAAFDTIKNPETGHPLFCPFAWVMGPGVVGVRYHANSPFGKFITKFQ